MNCWIKAVLLNWIAWNGNVFDIQTVYLWLSELFEIERFICLRIDLALNNLQGLIFHKPAKLTSLVLSLYTLVV